MKQPQQTLGAMFNVPARSSTRVATAARRARHLARLHHIGLDTSNSSQNNVAIWLTPPPAFSDAAVDPLYDDRFCGSWEEALEKVQTYVDALHTLVPKSGFRAALLQQEHERMEHSRRELRAVLRECIAALECVPGDTAAELVKRAHRTLLL